ncbi:MAG: 3-phosphoshikimate 1-carboxyvinyltransferase [Thermoanaerobaculaceae bacterium]|jgi:3-phosphoshikimate 1-carboxyvinyltransferase|nr:3-phosphoshikimate 1-carboxyvinyltransferase [Thermoanaerobaculaceae bacterium]
MVDAVRVLPDAPLGIAGRIAVPPSKSLTQRALVAVARAGPGARVQAPLDAEDSRLLVAGLRAAGFALRWVDDVIAAAGHDQVDGARVELGNNGTGMRLLLAQLAGLPGRFVVDGSSRLRDRPVAPLVGALRDLGAGIRPEGHEGGDRLPLVIEGRALTGGRVTLDSSASSQFVSALLMLAPLLPTGLEVRLRAAPPSRPYIELTLEVLRAFGIEAEAESAGLAWFVAPGPYRPALFRVEGDWSSAAFPLVAAAVAGGEVEVLGVVPGSPQGDARVLDILVAAGCRATATAGGLRLEGPATHPLDADLRDTPDLFPVLAVALARLGGRLSGLAGLVHKESDRLGEMVRLLRELGMPLHREGDEVRASGGGRPVPPGHELDPAGDHRIAMALAVAGLTVPGLRLADSGCVGKSWPGFWDAWEGLVGTG